jgi:uncharacterized protein YegL
MAAHGKLEALNTAVREVLPHLKQIASENPNAEVFARVMEFNSSPRWHIPPTTLEQFVWQDFRNATGSTALGLALKEAAAMLKIPPMEERALPPVILLVSDGQPTDDYEQALQELNSLGWGKKAVRQAIAIGSDADKGCLENFVGPEIPVLEAHNAEQLIKMIRWTSTAALKAASMPATQAPGQHGTGAVNVPMPPPSLTAPASALDPW